MSRALAIQVRLNHLVTPLHDCAIVVLYTHIEITFLLATTENIMILYINNHLIFIFSSVILYTILSMFFLLIVSFHNF